MIHNFLVVEQTKKVSLKLGIGLIDESEVVDEPVSTCRPMRRPILFLKLRINQKSEQNRHEFQHLENHIKIVNVKYVPAAVY